MLKIWEVSGYRIEMSPFGGIKNLGLVYKEGIIEVMKCFTKVKTFHFLGSYKFQNMN